MSSLFDDNYNSLGTFLSKWYKEPDIQGIYIALCTYQAHFWLDEPSIFLQILGLPGSGKTELGIGAVNFLTKDKHGREESTLSKNSFLSGMGDDIGILPRLPGAKKQQNLILSNGIITFPDLSTSLLSLHSEESKAILGIMRRLYDGSYEKTVGSKGQQLQWKGKLTFLAACTPDIEDYWIIHRDMGERWLNIHWRTKTSNVTDLMAYANKATEQVGNQGIIKAGFQKRIRELLKHGANDVKVDPEVFNVTNSQAILLEILRTSIKREFTGRGYSVMGKGNMQMPTRTPKNLVSIARASATIRNNKEIDDFDLELTKRICFDSIPSKRAAIIKILLDWYPEPISKRELACQFPFSRTTIDRTLEDLRYLDVLTVCDLQTNPDEMIIPDESTGYDSNSLYAMKHPKALDMISLTPSIINLIQTSKLL